MSEKIAFKWYRIPTPSGGSFYIGDLMRATRNRQYRVLLSHDVEFKNVHFDLRGGPPHEEDPASHLNMGFRNEDLKPKELEWISHYLRAFDESRRHKVFNRALRSIRRTLKVLVYRRDFLVIRFYKLNPGNATRLRTISKKIRMLEDRIRYYEPILQAMDKIRGSWFLERESKK